MEVCRIQLDRFVLIRSKQNYIPSGIADEQTAWMLFAIRTSETTMDGRRE